jgi:phosphonate transport system ATP-binding protein
MSKIILEITNLKKSFDHKNGNVELFNNVNLKVKKGEFISILGPSGSGKTTLLRSINGLEKIENGEVIFNNNRITAENLPDVQRKTGMIFQEFNLVNNLSSINNVLTGLLNSSSKFLSMFYLFSKEQKLEALQSLKTVGLLDKSYNRVDELSGGQRQRIGIARAIIKKPLLLLADEPVASLDPKAALSTMKLLKRINKDFNITILCNLHQTDLAMEFSDRVIGLSEGAVIFDQEAKQLDKNIDKLYS